MLLAALEALVDEAALEVAADVLAEAALDLITYFLLSRGMKKQNEPPAAPEPAAPAEPEALPENTTEE